MEQIKGTEYFVDDGNEPRLDGDYIRNILVLGNESKNAWNATATSAGDSSGPRRSFRKIVTSIEEIAKFDGKPAYILHKQGPRSETDLIGSFSSPKSTDKGLRMDLYCLRAGESYHPQALALRDNVENKRPFGGFSPTFDFMVDPSTGELETVIAVESIDLVANPASVKSAVESGDEPVVAVEEETTGEPTYTYVTREEHDGLVKRVEACECYMKGKEEQVKAVEAETVPEPKQESVIKSVEMPTTTKVVTTATNFRDFIRN